MNLLLLTRAAVPTLLCMTAVTFGTEAMAEPVHWTDWLTRESTGVVTGRITLADGGTIDARLSGGNNALLPRNASFYWSVPGGGPSPYTSDAVPNGPAANASMVLMGDSAVRTMSFSTAVDGLVLSVLSLNANAYTFDHDFTIENYGAGYFGASTLTKEVTTDGRFRLVGAGEGTGTIRFSGSIESVSWAADRDEWWQGVTVGTYGQAAAVPEPPSLGLMAVGCLALTTHLRTRRRRESHPAG